jgi:long-chain acyl-CoA synthetase
MSLNLATLLTESVKRNPAQTAIIFDDYRMTYGQLQGASNMFANALRQGGLEQGQKVALMLPNIPQFLVCYYGILKAGGVVVPLNVLLKAPEVTYHLEDSDSVTLVAWEGFLEAAVGGFNDTPTCKTLVIVNAPGSQNVPQVEGATGLNAFMAQGKPDPILAQTMPDDTAVILYTSGTTGRPKGAELTHFNMFFNAWCAIKNLGVDYNENDIALMALPLFHSFGQTCVMNVTIGAGGTLSLIPRFEPVKAFEIIQRDKVTAFSGVPTMFFYLLNHPDRKNYDLSSLTKCTSGGSAIPVEVLHAWERETGVKILEGYGLSETSPVASFNVAFKPTKPGSIGVPLWGVDIKVVGENDQEVPVGEPGELLIRGHNVMKGYLNRPEATAEVMRGGWFHSGDIARMDEDGYFYIVDRLKDMIIRGGFNVYPREVEEVLYGHPAIAECAVIGIPDQALGEEVKAVIVLKQGQSLTEDDLRDYCRQRIASNKYPRHYEFRSDLPKNATGKILKRELKAAN